MQYLTRIIVNFYDKNWSTIIRYFALNIKKYPSGYQDVEWVILQG